MTNDELIENLKCCGNCLHHDGSNLCPSDSFIIREGWELCDKWSFDDFTKKERLDDEYNGN